MKDTCWARPAISGTAPDARCAHSSASSGKIFFFGGWNGRHMLNDLHILYPGIYIKRIRNLPKI